jgi:hypothetical protein
MERELGRPAAVAAPDYSEEPAMRRLRIVLIVVLVISAFIVNAAGDRQAEIRERGIEVMPFTLADTLHVFEKTPNGGVQRVLARPGHVEQIAPIREHLQSIAQQFETRDFSGPAHIHGDDMPGLAELRSAAKGDLSVAYRELDDGAEITYLGSSEDLRKAIHRWFDAQLSDHGHDASDHHRHHHSH